MKIVLTSLWGHPKKLTNRGLRVKDKVEAYLTTKLALETSIYLEKLGHLAFLATYGSFRDRCYFANRIKADGFIVFTSGFEPNPIIYFSEKSADKSRELAFLLKEGLESEASAVLGPVSVSQLNRLEKRYGLVSFLAPFIPALIISVPIFHYEIIDKNIDELSKDLARLISMSDKKEL